VWRAVVASPSAAGDEKLRKLLHHVHMVQHSFLTVWNRDEFKYHEISADRDIPSLLDWGRDAHAKMRAQLDRVDENALADELKMPWADRLVAPLGRTAGATTFGETMLQVPMHTLYHRGQVNLRLREVGGEPPLVDFIAWLWLGRPQPVWPD